MSHAGGWVAEVGRTGVSAVITFSNRHRQRAGERFAAPYLEHATVKEMAYDSYIRSK